jgi:prevent-host-death family protein
MIVDQAITASEANQHFSDMLRRVQQGESFVVTSRGRPVARVTGFEKKTTPEGMRELLDWLETQPVRHAGPWKREDLYEK